MLLIHIYLIPTEVVQVGAHIRGYINVYTKLVQILFEVMTASYMKFFNTQGAQVRLRL